MQLREVACTCAVRNLSLQKFIHFQLIGMSTTHLNPNGACDDNSTIFMTFLHFHCYQVS